MRRTGYAHEGPPPFFEALEARLLLSQAMVVAPDVRQYYPAGSATPADSVAPTDGLTPAQIRQAYGVNGIPWGSVTNGGAGQTIAIIEAYNDPNIVSDLQVFDSQFNLPACTLVRISQNGGTTLPGTDPDGPGGGWALETTLDVEWAHVIAPKATILLVEATTSADSDFYVAVSTASKHAGVSVVSMSWDDYEFATESSYDTKYFSTPGVAYTAASGDNGAYIDWGVMGM